MNTCRDAVLKFSISKVVFLRANPHNKASKSGKINAPHVIYLEKNIRFENWDRKKSFLAQIDEMEWIWMGKGLLAPCPFYWATNCGNGCIGIDSSLYPYHSWSLSIWSLHQMNKSHSADISLSQLDITLPSFSDPLLDTHPGMRRSSLPPILSYNSSEGNDGLLSLSLYIHTWYVHGESWDMMTRLCALCCRGRVRSGDVVSYVRFVRWFCDGVMELRMSACLPIVLALSVQRDWWQGMFCHPEWMICEWQIHHAQITSPLSVFSFILFLLVTHPTTIIPSSSSPHC